MTGKNRQSAGQVIHTVFSYSYFGIRVVFKEYRIIRSYIRCIQIVSCIIWLLV